MWPFKKKKEEPKKAHYPIVDSCSNPKNSDDSYLPTYHSTYTSPSYSSYDSSPSYSNDCGSSSSSFDSGGCDAGGSY